MRYFAATTVVLAKDSDEARETINNLLKEPKMKLPNSFGYYWFRRLTPIANQFLKTGQLFRELESLLIEIEGCLKCFPKEQILNYPSISISSWLEKIDKCITPLIMLNPSLEMIEEQTLSLNSLISLMNDFGNIGESDYKSPLFVNSVHAI